MLCSDNRIRGESLQVNYISRQQFSKIASRRFQGRMTLTERGLIFGAGTLLAPGKFPGRCRRGHCAWLHPGARQSAISDPRAAGERLVRQARRAFQAERAARAALARRRALAGGSRPGHLHIASDQSSRACPYQFYIWRRRPVPRLKKGDPPGPDPLPPSSDGYGYDVGVLKN